MNNSGYKTHSCHDIIIDGIQTIGPFERDSTGGQEKILVFSRMTL
jgi:hypothetical protein